MMNSDYKLRTARIGRLRPFLPPTINKIAKLISTLFSPPLLIIVGLALAATSIGTVPAWLWAGFYVIFAVLLPCGYIIWEIRRGNITDFHMKIREQRTKPLLLSLICSIIAAVGMWIGNAPQMYLIFGAVGVLQMALIFFITLKWKISGHSTAVSAFSVFVVALFGQMAAPILLSIPLVAWARVRLDRHEMLQTVAGSIAGIVFMQGVMLLTT